jgi:hypothetical protein
LSRANRQMVTHPLERSPNTTAHGNEAGLELLAVRQGFQL